MVALTPLWCYCLFVCLFLPQKVFSSCLPLLKVPDRSQCQWTRLSVFFGDKNWSGHYWPMTLLFWRSDEHIWPQFINNVWCRDVNVYSRGTCCLPFTTWLLVVGVAAGLFGTRVFKNDKEMISSAFNGRPSQRLYPGLLLLLMVFVLEWKIRRVHGNYLIRARRLRSNWTNYVDAVFHVLDTMNPPFSL